MIYNSVEVEAIKLSVNKLKNNCLSSKKFLVNSIKFTYEKYVSSGDLYYLENAIYRIYAYVELGYPLFENKDLFEEILNLADLSIDSMLLLNFNSLQYIMLNKVNLRNILGRWNPVLHSMKIEDVVKDILVKISNKEIGEYLYHCGKVIEDNDDTKTWEYMYKLYVNKTNNIFQDVKKNRYYVLRERK